MLNASRVNEILMDCLLTNDQIEDGRPKQGIDVIYASSVMNQFGLQKVKVNEHEKEIKSLLSLIDPSFAKGMSFLNMCMDKDGNHWGEHRNCDELLALGNAVGCAEIITALPAASLPGGMPYILINAEGV